MTSLITDRVRPAPAASLAPRWPSPKRSTYIVYKCIETPACIIFFLYVKTSTVTGLYDEIANRSTTTNMSYKNKKKNTGLEEKYLRIASLKCAAREPSRLRGIRTSCVFQRDKCRSTRTSTNEFSLKTFHIVRAVRLSS